jgi:putative PIN family toxin of toxin-antitoxin system
VSKVRSVIDTSVFFSAFLNSSSLPAIVVNAGMRGLYDICLSPGITQELNRILHSKAGPPEKIERFIESIYLSAIIADSLPEIGRVCRDPNDDHVLAAALVMKASFIVSGDQDLLAVREFHEVKIVTVREFADELNLI